MINIAEVDALYAEAEIEERENAVEVENYFKNLFSAFKTNIYVGVGSKYRTYVSVNLLDENDKEIFGANFTLDYESRTWEDETSKRILTMNHGCTGSFSSKAVGLVNRLKAMSLVWEHEQEITELFDSLVYTRLDAYRALDREYNKQQRALEQQAFELKQANAANSLVLGKTFEFEEYERWCNKDFLSAIWKYTITKLTPKRVYFEVVEKNKYCKRTCTAYMESKDVVNSILYHTDDKGVCHLNDDRLKGKTIISTDYEDTLE